jgi:uncharacterized membrane protein
MSRTGRRAPLFLKRGSYRKRRLRDAARMLPIVGAFLFALPMLWAQDGSTPEGTAGDGLYIFVVWLGLVAAAAAMAPGLGEEIGAGEAEGEGAEARGSAEG